MFKLMRYFKQVKWNVLGILCLLMVQAWCDLSLPQLTSDIVDVGIQQGGISHVAPEQLRTSTLEDLELFLTPGQKDEVEAAYAPAKDGVRRLTLTEPEELDRLDGELALPVVMLGELRNHDTMNPDALRRMLEDGTLTQDALLGAAQEELSHLQEQSQAILSQKALLFVRQEYEAMGLNLHTIQMRYLLLTGGHMLAVSLMMAMAAILVGLLAARAAAKIGMLLRGAVFDKVVHFSSGEIDQFSTASLITRSTNDVQQIQSVAVVLMRVVLYAPIIGIGGILKVANTRTGMGWIIAVAVGAALGVVAVLMSAVMPKMRAMQHLLDRLNLVSREILTGTSVIRAFSREQHEEERFDKASKELNRAQLFTIRTMNFMMPLMTLVMGVVSILIVWNGGHGIDAGTLQVGDMIAFITYTMQIVMAFLMIAMVSIMLPRAGVAAGRINEVLETVPAVADAPVTRDSEVAGGQGVISFEDVSFRYPDSDENVLSHISFTARPGETTAIIGSTGSGKSTLLNLIPRFFDVTGGRITLDGVDIRELSQHQLRSALGYVPQKGVLFSGTIASNLKFGGEHITDEQMRTAAAIAQAEDFIGEKPEGYESPVAQGGGNVSGGQRQRLSIARAIAAHPHVLLFDDSFSALDYKTDVALRRALHEQVRDAAVIIVAQRISTILHADQIIVLDEGKMVDMGTHTELLARCATYQEIARSQLSESELGGAGA